MKANYLGTLETLLAEQRAAVAEKAKAQLIAAQQEDIIDSTQRQIVAMFQNLADSIE